MSRSITKHTPALGCCEAYGSNTEDEKGDGDGVEKDGKRQKLHWMLKILQLRYWLPLYHFREHLRLSVYWSFTGQTHEGQAQTFFAVGRERLHASVCWGKDWWGNESIKNLPVVREATHIVSGISERSVIVHTHMREIPVKKGQWTRVRRSECLSRRST